MQKFSIGAKSDDSLSESDNLSPGIPGLYSLIEQGKGETTPNLLGKHPPPSSSNGVTLGPIKRPRISQRGGETRDKRKIMRSEKVISATEIKMARKISLLEARNASLVSQVEKFEKNLSELAACNKALMHEIVGLKALIQRGLGKVTQPLSTAEETQRPKGRVQPDLIMRTKYNNGITNHVEDNKTGANSTLAMNQGIPRDTSAWKGTNPFAVLGKTQTVGSRTPMGETTRDPVQKGRRKGLTKSQAEKAWAGELIFPATRFGLVKVLNVKPMMASSMKDLLNKAAGIKSGDFGGLTYSRNLGCWLMLLSKKIWEDPKNTEKIRLHPNFAACSVKEIMDNIEEMKSVAQNVHKFVSKTHKPLWRAAADLENGLAGKIILNDEVICEEIPPMSVGQEASPTNQ